MSQEIRMRSFKKIEVKQASPSSCAPEAGANPDAPPC